MRLLDKDYKVAAKGFEKVYKMSPKDTLYLYYAASAAVTDKDYDAALDYYNQLKDMGYTGIEMQYLQLIQNQVKRNFLVIKHQEIFL